MRALACIAVLALGASGSAQEGGGAPEPSAIWWTIPSEVEVGEPFRWLVEVRCPDGALRGLEDQLQVFADGLEPSWALLAPEPSATSPDVDGWLRRRAGWSAVSLEPGTRELPALTLQLVDGRSVTTEAASIEVAGVLATNEDAPRPARGLREVPGAEGDPNPLVLLGGGALLVAALAAFLLLRKRSGRKTPAPPSDRALLEERLRELEASLPSDPAQLRALFYELSGLLRATVDERAGHDRRGLTDDEWAGAVRGDSVLPPEARADLERFLARCSEVKYAAHEPTVWAVEEDLRAVRSVLAASAPANGSSRTIDADAQSADGKGGPA